MGIQRPRWFLEDVEDRLERAFEAVEAERERVDGVTVTRARILAGIDDPRTPLRCIRRVADLFPTPSTTSWTLTAEGRAAWYETWRRLPLFVGFGQDGRVAWSTGPMGRRSFVPEAAFCGVAMRHGPVLATRLSTTSIYPDGDRSESSDDSRRRLACAEELRKESVALAAKGDCPFETYDRAIERLDRNYLDTLCRSVCGLRERSAAFMAMPQYRAYNLFCGKSFYEALTREGSVVREAFEMSQTFLPYGDGVLPMPATEHSVEWMDVGEAMSGPVNGYDVPISAGFTIFENAEHSIRFVGSAIS